MSWVEKVYCRCGGNHWTVKDGSWTCSGCGQVMTIKAVADMYAREQAGEA